VQEPVQLFQVTGDHRRLQSSLLDEHCVLLRLVTHELDRIRSVALAARRARPRTSDSGQRVIAY
jgi:hypothetical protein